MRAITRVLSLVCCEDGIFIVRHLKFSFRTEGEFLIAYSSIYRGPLIVRLNQVPIATCRVLLSTIVPVGAAASAAFTATHLLHILSNFRDITPFHVRECRPLRGLYNLPISNPQLALWANRMSPASLALIALACFHRVTRCQVEQLLECYLPRPLAPL